MPPQSPLGHGGGVRLGQPGRLSRCLAFIFPHAVGIFQAASQAHVSHCVPDYQRLFHSRLSGKARTLRELLLTSAPLSLPWMLHSPPGAGD